MTVTFSRLGQMGRLGNQMFQIASTIGVAKMSQTDFILPPWQYEQDFNLHGCFSDDILITNTYTEPYFHFAKPNVPQAGITDLNGFFQSFRYFEHCEPYIKFVFESQYQERFLSGITSIHVRRGDYATLGNSYYTSLANTDYYDKAMAAVKSDCYYIFSDDIEWCKAKFKGNQFVFIEEQDPCISLAIMASCENNIIANSSFSWWAAYLNKHEDKKIIAPSKWFGPNLPHNTKDLLPHEWVKL